MLVGNNCTELSLTETRDESSMHMWNHLRIYNVFDVHQLNYTVGLGLQKIDLAHFSLEEDGDVN